MTCELCQCHFCWCVCLHVCMYDNINQGLLQLGHAQLVFSKCFCLCLCFCMTGTQLRTTSVFLYFVCLWLYLCVGLWPAWRGVCVCVDPSLAPSLSTRLENDNSGLQRGQWRKERACESVVRERRRIILRPFEAVKGWKVLFWNVFGFVHNSSKKRSKCKRVHRFASHFSKLSRGSMPPDPH